MRAAWTAKADTPEKSPDAMTIFRKVREAVTKSNMLQINNILHALEEAKHSLDQIIESAMDLPQCHG
jgi:hypothetical protein